ncbi:MAG: hypothetical protein A3F11_06975 [Gammaproteobacteria bacterium RIFCSPHIGHO2_12_FULL_37_14]|nr:MAG: hypothetical protein A3F11_06975 [Gammaproteobacteria bacterium RIFCSPHIGHO2_12_FULL_37_14]
MLNGLLTKIERVLSFYLGIEKEEAHPATVQVVLDKVVITNTYSYKRHRVKESWEKFLDSSIKNTPPEDCTKLGLAIGKAIAKNLVISFEKTKIVKRDS